MKTEIIPYIFCRDVPAMLDFLSRAFGFVEELREGTPRGGMHGQMTLDGQRIMLGSGGGDGQMRSPAETGTASQGVFIYLDEVDKHCARARAAGSEIVKEPEDLPYGRSYTARDPDGHPWFFAARPKT